MNINDCTEQFCNLYFRFECCSDRRWHRRVWEGRSQSLESHRCSFAPCRNTCLAFFHLTCLHFGVIGKFVCSMRKYLLMSIPICKQGQARSRQCCCRQGGAGKEAGKGQAVLLQARRGRQGQASWQAGAGKLAGKVVFVLRSADVNPDRMCYAHHQCVELIMALVPRIVGTTYRKVISFNSLCCPTLANVDTFCLCYIFDRTVEVGVCRPGGLVFVSLT